MLVQMLKTKTLDFASLENAKTEKAVRKGEMKALLFEVATCRSFSLIPDNPKWLEKVEEYVRFNYDALLIRFRKELSRPDEKT